MDTWLHVRKIKYSLEIVMRSACRQLISNKRLINKLPEEFSLLLAHKFLMPWLIVLQASTTERNQIQILPPAPIVEACKNSFWFRQSRLQKLFNNAKQWKRKIIRKGNQIRILNLGRRTSMGWRKNGDESFIACILIRSLLAAMNPVSRNQIPVGLYEQSFNFFL